MPQIAYWACWEKRIGGRLTMQDASDPSQARLSMSQRIRYDPRTPFARPAPPRPAWRMPLAPRSRACARRVALGARRRRRARRARCAITRSCPRASRPSRPSWRVERGARRPCCARAASTRSTATRRARSRRCARGATSCSPRPPPAGSRSSTRCRRSRPALADPEARTLLLFPLRALEQDQRKKLEADIARAARCLAERARPRVADLRRRHQARASGGSCAPTRRTC